MTLRLSVAKDFSEFPAGRFHADGPFSGEAFRDNVLVPALRKAKMIELSLDGTMGYGSSFLEEAFGGLVRVHKFTAAELRSKLKFTSSDRSLEDEVWSYVEGAERSSRRA